MKIVVLIKQVPDTTEVRIDRETNTLIREGVPSIINPFDTYAIEEGLRIRDAAGEGEVVVMSMGPPQVETALREALSLGVDRAVLLSDRAFAGADTWATSSTLAAGIEKLGDYDVVLCGRQTLDGDTGQVGPGLSEMLGIPFVSYVSKVEEVGEGRIQVQRMVEEGYETIEMDLPAVITVVKEINVPRVPSLRGTMKSKTAEIPVWSAADIGAEDEKAGLAGSPTRVVRVFFPQRERRSEMLEGSTEEQVDKLVGLLEDIV